MSSSVCSADSPYDRAKEVKEFDETKLGVKGLLDNGIQSIPRFFHHPPSSLDLPVAAGTSIPVVDLSLPHAEAVEAAAAAARDWGFFQLINHGVPSTAISATLCAVQAFNELPAEAKSAYYCRDPTRTGVTFNTNFDLHFSAAATWRDTLQMRTGKGAGDPSKIPEICRRELVEWDGHARGVAAKALELLCEGMGVEGKRLEELSCVEGRLMVCHYYPYCPEAHLTMGLAGHTDPGVLTVLIQNEVVPGLQVRKEGGAWVDVDPIAGGIIINVGDTLQMISNDEYKSVEHKVVANPGRKPRVSIAIFCNPSVTDESAGYGPLPELISPERPAKYRDFSMPEFIRAFLGKQLGSKAPLDNFRA